ncbi:DUF4411 family protein [Phenylobacterium sp.]|uniref:DUF4411 family protein n=1 Tax=Phenylobacterium sp. TaxID=1871053 RepID=UPI00392022E0
MDTDAIAHMRDRPDAALSHDRLIQCVRDGHLKTVEQVFDELRRWPEVVARFRPVKRAMLVASQYSPEVQDWVGRISEDFDFLFDLTGSKNPDPADPWLIACAKVYGYTLVTDERPASTKKIPFVCRQQGVDVRCINGPTLLQELGYV